MYMKTKLDKDEKSCENEMSVANIHAGTSTAPVGFYARCVWYEQMMTNRDVYTESETEAKKESGRD